MESVKLTMVLLKVAVVLVGYNNTYFNPKSSGVYIIANFCRMKCSNTKAYYDTTSGEGG